MPNYRLYLESSLTGLTGKRTLCREASLSDDKEVMNEFWADIENALCNAYSVSASVFKVAGENEVKII